MFERQKEPQKTGEHHKRALRNEQRPGCVHECRGFVFYLRGNAEMHIHKEDCEWSTDPGRKLGQSEEAV